MSAITINDDSFGSLVPRPYCLAVVLNTIASVDHFARVLD